MGKAHRASGISRAALVAAGLIVLAASPVTAQVTYNRDPNAYNPFYPFPPLPFSDPSAYDQAFDVVPSYQIKTDPYAGGPPVRVVARCLFPDGWNVTDFTRAINGVPPGIHHQCPTDAVPDDRRVRAAY